MGPPGTGRSDEDGCRQTDRPASERRRHVSRQRDACIRAAKPPAVGRVERRATSRCRIPVGMTDRTDECDWCGRAGTIREYSSTGDPETEFENPCLCDVCWLFILNVPGDAEEALMGIDGYDEALKAFEQALKGQHRGRIDN